MKILIATGNEHKAGEIAAILGEQLRSRFDALTLLTTRDIPPHESPVEDGETFLENALKKGRFYASMAGVCTLADDSGLEVEALGGQPGLYSSRYAPDDRERIERLLGEMGGVAPGKRDAHFICTAVLVHPTGKAWTSRVGYCYGEIGSAAHGDQGFGFDPVFYIPELGKTMADLPMEEKNKISHRARALQELIPLLNKLIDLPGGGQDNYPLNLFEVQD